MHYETKDETGASRMSTTQMVNIEFEEIAPGIVIYKNINKAGIDIIDSLESIANGGDVQWIDASVKSGDENGINKNQRDTKTLMIPYQFSDNETIPQQIEHLPIPQLSKILKDIISPAEKHYFANYGINYTIHDVFTALKYGIGQNFINHIDDHPDFHRRVSTVYYLNDNYDGGEINFPRFNISYKPKADELIIFPSTYVYNHSVSPVISGTRYGIVSWIK
jgi:predicted 2-oxoglutarate/Fe(II)-dependent dioxygenase YbiX